MFISDLTTGGGAIQFFEHDVPPAGVHHVQKSDWGGVKKIAGGS